VFKAALPIRTDADRDTALKFLAASGAAQLGGPLVQAATAVPGALATSDFLDAARDRGTVTDVNYGVDSETDFEAQGSGKLGVELGGGLEVKHESLESQGGRYWDGTGWQPWAACG
jgi:hypothetical protein